MPFPTSDLSHENILRDIHDPVSQSIRTTASAIIAPGLEIDISHTEDSVRLGNGTNFLTSTTVLGKIGLDVNLINTSVPVTIADPIAIEIDAADGDNILSLGTEDGTLSGTRHVLKIGSDLNLRVKDEDVLTTLNTINTTLSNPLNVNLDGFSVSPDSAIFVGTEDGTNSGVKHAARVDSDLDLRVGISDGINKAEVTASNELKVEDSVARTTLNNIYTILNSGVVKVDDDETQTAINNVLTQLQSGGIIIGTEDGTPTGTQFVFVNNIRKQILDSHDRQAAITYADFGTKDQRVTQIDYTSATFPGVTTRKQFLYTLTSGKYRRDNINWIIV